MVYNTRDMLKCADTGFMKQILTNTGHYMRKDSDLLKIIQAALGTFDNRQSFTPGMFEALFPLFEQLEYKSVAVYIADDYPDRMHRVCAFGGDTHFPAHIVLNKFETLFEECEAKFKNDPSILVNPLFSHGRELGVIAVTHSDPEKTDVRSALAILAKALSVMAYVEFIRSNSYRERQERDTFFAQSLTNRLLLREPPKMRELKLGFEFIRSLEACGDFFDLIPEANGGIAGFIGSCNGQGLRTVMEVAGIMRSIHRASYSANNLSEIIKVVNELLVHEQHRAHQASLAVFKVDVKNQKLTIAKAGRIGMLLCGPGSDIENISAPGSTFLGMIEHPELTDEEYDFTPGQSLFAVTDGIYSARNIMNVQSQPHWFLESVQEVLKTRYKKPLANAIFDAVNKKADHTARPEHSLLALSVEFRGRNRESLRMSATK